MGGGPRAYSHFLGVLVDLVGRYRYVCPPFNFLSRPVLTKLPLSRLDLQPGGWLPPLSQLLDPYVDQNSPPAPPTYIPHMHGLAGLSPPTTPDPPEFDTFDYESPDVLRDGVDSTGSASTSSTRAGSALSRSPSPPVPTRKSIRSVRRTKGRRDSPEPSPIQTLREKGRKKIRQGSGVKTKKKVPARAVPSPYPPPEVVQCRWAKCTKLLSVDYVSVRHLGGHVRAHYADDSEMTRCRWEGGCGAEIHKSSMWKHVVVHQPKFKVRCPFGCDVMTREDMMARHLRSCPFNPGRAAEVGESEGEEDVELGEVSHAGDYDCEGEGDYEGGKEVQRGPRLVPRLGRERFIPR